MANTPRLGLALLSVAQSAKEVTLNSWLNTATNGLDNAALVTIANVFSNYQQITLATPAIANYGLLSLGSGGFAGGAVPNFQGVAAGTTLAINTTAAFAGDHARFQRGGVDTFRVTGPGQLVSILTDAVTAAVSYPVALGHNSSGTPAVGFATGIQINGMNAAATVTEFGTLRWALAVATAGAEDLNTTLAVKRAGTTTDHTRWFAAGSMAVLGSGISLGTGVAPTAVLHMKAGTTAANTAPVKFTTGSLLTTPEAGTLEFLTPTLSATPVSTRRTLTLGSDAVTAGTTVSNTVTETSLGQATLAANELAAGKCLRFRVVGRYSTANGTDTVTFRFRLNTTGGTVLGSLTVVSTAGTVTDAPLDLDLVLTCRTAGGSGTVMVYIGGQVNNVGKAVAATATTTVDTTVAENILCTATWSNALAGNTLTREEAFCVMLT